jgi:general secretion pathway protein G
MSAERAPGSSRRREGPTTRRCGGFTMVELAIVAAIISILTAMVIPVVRYTVKRQDELELRYSLRTMRDAIDKYKQYSDSGLIPPQIGTEGFPTDLQTLVDGVSLVGQINKKQKFLRRVPIDPMTKKAEWGLRSFQDEPDSSSWGGQNVYDIYSLSPLKAIDGTFYKDW